MDAFDLMDKAADAIDSLRARLAKYEDAEGRPVVDAQRLLDWNRSQPEPRPIVVGREYQVAEACARLNSSPVSLNQCDGCRAGIPAENGMHAMGIPGGYADKMMCTASRYESAPSHGEQVQDGWKLVPIKPTSEMLAATIAGSKMENRADLRPMIYRAMLAAAPSAGSQEKGE